MARRAAVKTTVEPAVETNEAPVETTVETTVEAPVETTVETTVETPIIPSNPDVEFSLLSSLEDFAKAMEVTAAPVKTNKLGIGKFIQDLMIKDPTRSNKDLLKAALEQFPTAQTSSACIAWYRSDLRKKGLIPTK